MATRNSRKTPNKKSTQQVCKLAEQLDCANHFGKIDNRLDQGSGHFTQIHSDLQNLHETFEKSNVVILRNGQEETATLSEAVSMIWEKQYNLENKTKWVDNYKGANGNYDELDNALSGLLDLSKFIKGFKKRKKLYIGAIVFIIIETAFFLINAPATWVKFLFKTTGLGG